MLQVFSSFIQPWSTWWEVNCSEKGNVPEMPQPHDASPGGSNTATVLLLLPPSDLVRPRARLVLPYLLSAITREVGLRRWGMTGMWCRLHLFAG